MKIFAAGLIAAVLMHLPACGGGFSHYETLYPKSWAKIVSTDTATGSLQTLAGRYESLCQRYRGEGMSFGKVNTMFNAIEGTQREFRVHTIELQPQGDQQLHITLHGSSEQRQTMLSAVTPAKQGWWLESITAERKLRLALGEDGSLNLYYYNTTYWSSDSGYSYEVYARCEPSQRLS